MQAIEQDLYIRSSKLSTKMQGDLNKNGVPNSVFEEKITPDIQGLINYFTAPNIRNKIRHPLFLALKFYECVQLYYNPKKVSSSDDRSIGFALH